MNPIVLYKKEGETPLECINRAKEEGKIAKDQKATYAGRLDPMAEGLLLVLTGDLVHKKDEYIKLSKEYEIEVMLGVSTDTGDILGKIQNTKPVSMFGNSLSPCLPKPGTGGQARISQHSAAPDREELERGDVFRMQIQNVLEKCIGEFEEEYPNYSSKTIEGKPLFSLARLGEIFHIKVPKHTVTIHSIILENVIMRNLGEVAGESIERIKKVKGDFRQEDIISLWEKIGKDQKDEEVLIIKIKVACESGAYMRVLAEKIGKLLGYPALALSIKRTKVGEHSV